MRFWEPELQCRPPYTSLFLSASASSFLLHTVCSSMFVSLLSSPIFPQTTRTSLSFLSPYPTSPRTDIHAVVSSLAFFFSFFFLILVFPQFRQNPQYLSHCRHCSTVWVRVSWVFLYAQGLLGCLLPRYIRSSLLSAVPPLDHSPPDVFYRFK